MLIPSLSMHKDDAGESLEFADEIFDQARITRMAGFGLAGREFYDCVFQGLRIAETSLEASVFVDCRFMNCDLSNARVKNARFKSVTFSSSKLLGLDWTRVRELGRLEFEECNLSFSNFTSLDLRKLKLCRCRVHEAHFAQTNLAQSDCSGSDFSRAEFAGANLEEACFKGALNYDIHPGKCRLTGAKFSLPEATVLLRGLGIILE